MIFQNKLLQFYELWVAQNFWPIFHRPVNLMSLNLLDYRRLRLNDRCKLYKNLITIANNVNIVCLSDFVLNLIHYLHLDNVLQCTDVTDFMLLQFLVVQFGRNTFRLYWYAYVQWFCFDLYTLINRNTLGFRHANTGKPPCIIVRVYRPWTTKVSK